MRHDSFICMTLLVHTCDNTFTCVTWLIHRCNTPLSYVRHDLLWVQECHDPRTCNLDKLSKCHMLFYVYETLNNVGSHRCYHDSCHRRCHGVRLRRLWQQRRRHQSSCHHRRDDSLDLNSRHTSSHRCHHQRRCQRCHGVRLRRLWHQWRMKGHIERGLHRLRRHHRRGDRLDLNSRHRSSHAIITQLHLGPSHFSRLFSRSTLDESSVDSESMFSPFSGVTCLHEALHFCDRDSGVLTNMCVCVFTICIYLYIYILSERIS